MECRFPPMNDLVPDIDANVPLPASANEAMPELSVKEELAMRARTVKMLADLQGKPIEVSEEHRGEAMQMIEQIALNKSSPDLAQYPNETIAYLAGMVAQYDHMIVRELADLKIYVVNKLLQETDNVDGKLRLGALKALGEIDGIDAFKKRSEVTVKHKPLEEVENELLETLQKLERRTISVSARVVSNENHA
jgi:hypothetical protein|tara:strand:+ start:62 stop:640 length:579 start_codon:yes stop_codon:yes gene_type:complete